MTELLWINVIAGVSLENPQVDMQYRNLEDNLLKSQKNKNRATVNKCFLGKLQSQQVMEVKNTKCFSSYHSFSPKDSCCDFQFLLPAIHVQQIERELILLNL